MSKKILVIGASSKVGTALVELLSEAGEGVKAASRTELSGLGSNAEHVTFDYDNSGTWDGALEGVDRVFLMARPMDIEADQVVNPFVDKAVAAGVRRIVIMTALGVDASDDIPLRKAELHLQSKSVEHVILRPTWFDQNFSAGFIGDSIRTAGGFYLPAEDAKVGFIDARDIAAVAVKALTEDGHAGKAYPLTGGQALTHTDAASIISDAAGKEITYTSVPEDDARKGMLEQGWPEPAVDYMLMLFSSIRAGAASNTTDTVQQVLGRAPISFEQFAQDNADSWR
jgi:uncharacterized protein YbjT (DUF2867 family)